MTWLQWLKWYLWDTRVCRHARGEGLHIDCGMGKAWHCTKCGKLLELV